MRWSYQKQKNFFDYQDKFRILLRENPILLFLDFDGTLAAVVDHYKKATILKESEMILKKIIQDPECLVSIVSGRALADVKKRVGLKNIVYSGNHGLEVQGPGIKYTLFTKVGIKELIRNIKSHLIKNVGKISGVLIEDKKLTLSVHYRKVKQADLAVLEKLFWGSVDGYLKNRDIRVNVGKKVFEINPNVKWDKGKVILWLIDDFQRKNSGQKMFSVFIGDDETDETAFKALKRRGLCIRVGESKMSAAPYFLKDIKQVTRFLKTVVDVKADR